MSIEVQLRRGTAAENAAFTGQEGELVYTTDTMDLFVHDGSTAGGTPVGRFIDNETLQSVTVNQGSGDISTASNFGLGGRIDFITGAPKQMQDLEVYIHISHT